MAEDHISKNSDSNGPSAPSVSQQPLPRRAPTLPTASDLSHDQRLLAARFYTMALEAGYVSHDNIPSSFRDLLASAPAGSAEAVASSLATGQRESSRKTDSPKVRKILALDGGGVRGLSIIIILKHLMRNLNRKRQIEVQPWEEFDMIGGTSTGGIIAIMLGRLRMSLDQCEAAYIRLSSNVFKRNRSKADPRKIYDFLEANGKFSPQPLEGFVKDLL